ncbi:Ribonuclease [Aquicella siphonis]|uniref:Ribonuclease n=1 Tax=Aquicella siphonis TaxID=254247 RepID=A0A5E4PLQ2_9COXI|nr:MBL fold metallo-hydrolase [Aquicella siphonis]VVC77233.1 Ribonuclease [Aquicella siphonis]
MEISFLGAARTVTGSKYLLTVKNKKFMIDCGLYQGYKDMRLKNWDKLPVNPQEIEAVILTHAHVDHSGYIPLLVKNGFRGKIYCTRGTRDLCSILLPDCGHLEEEDAARANRYGYSKHTPALPLYTYQDAIQALDYFMPLDFDSAHELTQDLTLKLLPSGHIIGASLVRLEHHGQSILFTGDLGRKHHPIMRAPAIVTHSDYLVIESTYGDRLHSASSPENQLADVVNNTLSKEGSVIIPAFAVGRSQDILYYLYSLKEQGRIPDVPVYLDSPMAQDVSDLFCKYADEHQLPENVCIQVCKTAKYIRTPEESKAVSQSRHSKIIISASGMATGGRILHHLKAFLPYENHTILFTGYQAPGTRGDRLMRGETEIKIHGEYIPVRASILMMENMSAHADYQEMLDWLKHFKQPPGKVFITHGMIESALSLSEKISTELGWACQIPEYLQTASL